MNEFFIDQDEANIEANGNKANSEVIKLEKNIFTIIIIILCYIVNTNIEANDKKVIRKDNKCRKKQIWVIVIIFHYYLYYLE